MKHFAFALAAIMALAAPASAYTMIMPLPSLSYPDGSVTSSTKDCATTTSQAGCPKQE